MSCPCAIAHVFCCLPLLPALHTPLCHMSLQEKDQEYDVFLSLINSVIKSHGFKYDNGALQVRNREGKRGMVVLLAQCVPRHCLCPWLSPRKQPMKPALGRHGT